ncbi:hypothetical protein PVAP13_5NG555686 [Panicum virgatum]|uniref:Uncharacterized protein n=1 Tax=Panicum virgatum TaxID=38727 RepID=A0A8T0S5Y6_PANVG|nr:hypothetical protein PVAP13_5NG555686 [Panicum virgatum]
MELARRRWSRCPTSPSTPTGCAPLRPPSLQLPPEPCSPAGARPPLPPPPSRPRRTGEGEIEPSSPRSRERALSKKCERAEPASCREQRASHLRARRWIAAGRWITATAEESQHPPTAEDLVPVTQSPLPLS